LRVVGIIFVILALLGFWHQEQPIFDVISNNLVDAIFHLVIGVIALILGFVTKHKCHNH
jgi:hypothetical protein